MTLWLRGMCAQPECKENNRLAYSTFTKGECERGHTNLGTKPSGGHYCRTCNADRMRRVRHDALAT